MEWIVALLMISVFAWRAVVGARDYQTLKAASETVIRQRIMKSWVAEGVILFGLGSAIILAILGRLPALIHLPIEFTLPLPDDIDLLRVRRFGYMICGGLLLGSAVPLVSACVQSNENHSAGAGDFAALYPRNGTERIWGILLALSAGITEEMMFRVTLPLLLTLATGNMGVAFSLSIPIFGLLHFYQGWKGVAATSLAAALFTIIYLATASLLLAIAIHVWIDINALVLVPLAAAHNHRRKGDSLGSAPQDNAPQDNK